MKTKGKPTLPVFDDVEVDELEEQDAFASIEKRLEEIQQKEGRRMTQKQHDTIVARAYAYRMDLLEKRYSDEE